MKEVMKSTLTGILFILPIFYLAALILATVFAIVEHTTPLIVTAIALWLPVMWAVGEGIRK